MLRMFKTGFLALLLLLAGCAELAPQAEPVTSVVDHACYARITLGGRFSVQYRKDGKDESVHGAFRWEQDGDTSRIALLSPLGQTLATIDVTSQQASFTPAGQSARSASDADALAAETLGWPLPVAGLRDWLQACMRDHAGRPRAITKSQLTTTDGWRIAYPVWDGEGSARRPKRIDLQRQGDSVTDISLRLVIDEWLPR